MNELINTTKTYCKTCGRFIGYMQKDRCTLQAPETICHTCEQAKKRQAVEYQVTGKGLINTVCAVALTLVCIVSGLLVLHHIIN